MPTRNRANREFPLPRRPAGGWLGGDMLTGPAWLTGAGILVSLLVSPNLLVSLDIPYAVQGGPFVVKIHPGTWLIGFAFLGFLLRHGNPVGALFEAYRRQSAATLFAVTIVVMLVYSVASYGASGAAFLIDALLRPALAAILLDNIHPMGRRRIYHLLIAALAVNAVIGLFESALQIRIVPYMRGNVLMTEDHFRATALVGHPLSNALLTLLALLGLLPLREFDGRARILLLALFALALLAFGSRTGLALAVVFGMLHWATGLWRGSAAMPRFLSLAWMKQLPVVLAAIGGLIIAVQSHFGERIFATFYFDSSAAARILVLRIPTLLSQSEWWVGMSPHKIDMILYYMKRTTTLTDIENNWILFLMQFGLPLTAMFTVMFFLFLNALRRSRKSDTTMLVLAFLIFAVSNNTMASKSSDFVVSVALILARDGWIACVPAMRRRAAPQAALMGYPGNSPGGMKPMNLPP